MVRTPMHFRSYDITKSYIKILADSDISLMQQIFLTLSVLYGLGNHTKQVAFEDAATASLYNWTFGTSSYLPSWRASADNG